MARPAQNLPSVRSIWLFVLLVCASGSQARAKEPEATPLVLLIATAQDGAGKLREQRLLEELALSLDRFAIRKVTPHSSGFAASPLPAQLAELRSLSEGRPVVASVWLDDAPGELVLLHLVALSTGRALVRIVEAKRAPDLEQGLALVTRELLGEAYLFAPEPARAKPVSDVVKSVRAQVAQASAPRAERFELSWSFFAQLAALSSSTLGPRSAFGASAGVGARTVRALWLHVSAQASASPEQHNERARGSMRRYGAQLSARYAFALGALRLGPLVMASVERQQLELRADPASVRKIAAPSARVGFGLMAELAFADRWFGYVDGAGALELARLEVRRASDDQTLWKDPALFWGTHVGIGLRL